MYPGEVALLDKNGAIVPYANVGGEDVDEQGHHEEGGKNDPPGNANGSAKTRWPGVAAEREEDRQRVQPVLSAQHSRNTHRHEPASVRSPRIVAGCS